MSRKILVVDDNKLIRMLVGNYLLSSGWSVEQCDGPFGVLNKARDYQPDVVLMDLRMPGLGGDKLAAMLKNTAKTGDIKILAFSSEDEIIQRQMVEKGIIDGYFMKTRSLDGLTEAIDHVLGRDDEQSQA